MKRISGFTLIEVLVVTGVIALLMIGVTNILFSSYKAKTRVVLADRVEEEGTTVLREIKNNVITAYGAGMKVAVNPGGVGSSIVLTNIKDGGVTTLKCVEGANIASESAEGNFDLTSSLVRVSGCTNFARGETSPSSPGRVTQVDFEFRLSSGSSAAGSENFVSRDFKTSVVVRN